MLKEIGSNFWINPNEIDNRFSTIDTSIFQYHYEDIVFTSSGRGAISLVLNDIIDDNRKVFLPSFTCESVITPFIDKGYTVFFYKINNDLSVDLNHFIEDVKKEKPSIVYFHQYFGFDTMKADESLADWLKFNGIKIIEDTTHSLYSSIGRLAADYQIGSFRKWTALPDGGYALKKNESFLPTQLFEDDQLVNAKMKAMESKFEYMIHGVGNKEAFLRQYAEAEELIDKQKSICSMSKKSKSVQASLNIEDLKKKRRTNYRSLLDEIENNIITPVFQQLSSSMTPLYFPVFCRGKRSELQLYLRERNIYAPIIWPINKYSDESKNNNRMLYDDMLCIPCDQRYGEDEMLYIATTINDFK